MSSLTSSIHIQEVMVVMAIVIDGSFKVVMVLWWWW
jgi:hypothetical protein